MSSEARIEFGEKIASLLKLSSDGTKVLWPQPSDDPEDPQNVSQTALVAGFTGFSTYTRIHSGPTVARFCT